MNKKDPEMLQRGGLSGGATSADSKTIYSIAAMPNTADDLTMFVSVFRQFYSVVFVFLCVSLGLLNYDVMCL